MIRSGGASRQLAPGFTASADASLSFDAKQVLFAGKKREGDPWRVWEMSLAGGAPRQVTAGLEDCIRPHYLPRQKVVYARRTPAGFQIEVAPLDGGAPSRLTFAPANLIPAAVLRDGRVMFESGGEIYTVYGDGSGVESYRCDHASGRFAAAQLASGDVVFQVGPKLGRFTSARAVQLDVPLPEGDFAGPVAEIAPGQWLVHCDAGICRVAPGSADAPAVVVKGDAYQPVAIAPRSVPRAHPSSLGNRDGANLLCLDAHASRAGRLPSGAIAAVRVWSQCEEGGDIALGSTPVDSDGSFFVQVPSERPLRFELLDRAGKTVRAEKGWFWTRQGEQRVCVGCHTGPERAPENVVPKVLLRTQTPVPLGLGPAQTGGRQ